MAEPVIMPRQGQSVESCIITKIFIEEGEKVSPGDLLFAYETDKASFEEEAKHKGILLRWMFIEGDEVPVLETVCYIGDKDEDIVVQPAAKNLDKVDSSTLRLCSGQAGSGTDKTEEKVERVDNAEKVEGKLKISPRALKLALDLGIDSTMIEGSGPGGRVIVSDIENYDLQHNVCVSTDEYTSEPLTNIRKLIAEAMHNSLMHAAQLTHHLGADARRLLSYREAIKKKQDKPGNINITINDMVCMAVIKVLKEHPRLNAHFFGEEIRLFKRINLGLAVDTERGLMVPVLRAADTMSVQEFSNAAVDLAAKCRKGSIDPDILSSESASFTVSNLGSYGVEMFTPVINLPQVAILGVNAIVIRPVTTSAGEIDFLPYIGLSLTYDHRAIDGGEATRFLKHIATEIETLELDI